jgi:hypothetical protein
MTTYEIKYNSTKVQLSIYRKHMNIQSLEVIICNPIIS